MNNDRSWRVLKQTYQQILAELLLGGQERAVLRSLQIWLQ